MINDVSQLNPVKVARVVKPQSIDDVVNVLLTSSGPISIGGGCYSMGGQIAYENSTHLDMLGLNRIIDYKPELQIITVQAGIRWHDIQHQIDKDNLSIKIMQTYTNFTVGGSLSVNAHGRYVCQGPIIYSVKSIVLVLADGTIVNASPTDHSDLFYGAIGGYGALGVIVEVTLELVKNVKIERQESKLCVENYRQYFYNHIRQNKKAIFHNADLYPPHYQQARVITWFESDKVLTTQKRVASPKSTYILERYFVWAILTTPFGKWRREYIIDPLLYLRPSVTWRNTEASRYHVSELEPRSRKKKTFLLQEYFIPVMLFDEFLPKMVEILQYYQVNALNISVRHANKDPGSLLAWAKDEVFAFVLYYKQGTSATDNEIVGIWTRELIDAAISVGGSYYLPYQLHATREQFQSCYPKWQAFFALKNKYDPDNRFRNKLLKKYYENKIEDEIMMDTSSEFKSVYSNTIWKDKFFLFLKNIYNIYPEDKFHQLIKESCEKFNDDRDIYLNIQKELPKIKPFLADLRYALPALIKQKNEMVRQTEELLGKDSRINGYVEIGSTGRYISKLRKHININNPVYLINDLAPGYSPVDIMERGSLIKIGEYIPLSDYDPVSKNDIPDACIDLATCYVGLHHIPLDKIDKFIQSIHRILRVGGVFIVRDHNVDSDEMRTFVNLVHTVFNAGLGVSWEENIKELRYFTSINKLVTLLEENGFYDDKKRVLQPRDPSDNTLIKFVKS